MLNLKGIWIPIEILLDRNLNDKEKLVYSLIIFLSKESNSCFCTNSLLSKLLNISITRVSKIVNLLKTKEYIDIKMKYKENSKEIENRILIPIFKDNATYLTKVQYPIKQNFNRGIEEKFKDKKYNNNINKNNNEKNSKTNFEERDYSNFDWNSLYANYEWMKN